MTLAELSPRFIKRTGERSRAYVERIEEAEGIQFLCPRCFINNGGAVGTHSILCWNLATPSEISPGPGRWDLHGTDYADLTLVGAGTSSVLLPGEGCGAHFHISNGMVIWC